MLKLLLSRKQYCDLRLIHFGAFHPIHNFMNKADYESVVSEMRLANGTLWPMPVTLDLPRETVEKVQIGDEIEIMHPFHGTIGSMTIEEMWEANLEWEMQFVFGTQSREHAGVYHRMGHANPYYISGRLNNIKLPELLGDFSLNFSPAEVKKIFADRGWENVIGFHTRNPPHMGHLEMLRRIMEEHQSPLFLHPTVGFTTSPDTNRIDVATRILCYQEAEAWLGRNQVLLGVCPMAMLLAGPREALMHALVRKNYGCGAFVVGRDHAGPPTPPDAPPFYGHYEAHELLEKYRDEIGLKILCYPEMLYDQKSKKFFFKNKLPKGCDAKSISGTWLRSLTRSGEIIPEWYTLPKINAILSRSKALNSLLVMIACDEHQLAMDLSFALKERLSSEKMNAEFVNPTSIDEEGSLQTSLIHLSDIAPDLPSIFLVPCIRALVKEVGQELNDRWKNRHIRVFLNQGDKINLDGVEGTGVDVTLHTENDRSIEVQKILDVIQRHHWWKN